MQKSEYEVLKLENQLCFPLYAASRKVISLYTPYLKPLGLTYTQYLVFLVLSEQKRMTVGEICEKLYLNNGTLSPLLKTLEKNGFLTRQRSTADERTVLISLTDKGKELLEQLKEIPPKIGNCIPIDEKKALQLYILLYEILHE
ncbi:MAG: MarR family transcriptional regulator [Oscillospiraceae bacterium]|nr:MarR family transcriptional regulator [Oscillospiraceae bacterium]MBR1530388.1 MarR family transcriptional regulator [Oscillospiraceae bacterium]